MHNKAKIETWTPTIIFTFDVDTFNLQFKFYI
jgi:hypothetical protein